MNHGTVRKVLRGLKYHAYKLSIHEVLLPGDEGRRIEFCG